MTSRVFYSSQQFWDHRCQRVFAQVLSETHPSSRLSPSLSLPQVRHNHLSVSKIEFNNIKFNFSSTCSFHVTLNRSFQTKVDFLLHLRLSANQRKNLLALFNFHRYCCKMDLSFFRFNRVCLNALCILL